MKKEELDQLLKSLNIPVSEGIQNDININAPRRIVYWDFIWDSITASGSKYEDLVTYQISFYSPIPRDPTLLKLRKKLNEMKINPRIQIEYSEEDRYWHSFFAIEVAETLEVIEDVGQTL
jgi:hypothetical protein